VATAAIIAGGTIISSAIGSRETRKAGQTQADAAREAAAISAEAFREAGGIEAGGFRAFADVERQAAGAEAAGIREAGGLQAGGLRDFAGIERQAGDIGAAGFREAAGRFEPFAVGGQEAAQQEAALSGALGPAAQQAAISAQVESPFTRFIEQRGREQIGQGFAATGGLGGGQRLKALTEFGQGVATQSLSQQLQNLRNVRQAGVGATTNIANLIGQAAGAEAGGIRGAGVAQLGAQDVLAQAIRSATGVEAGGIRGGGLAELTAQQALATGVRGVGGAEATGVSQAGQAEANARIARQQQIQQGIGGLTSVFALQQQGLFDRPPSPFTGPTTSRFTSPNQLLIEPV